MTKAFYFGRYVTSALLKKKKKVKKGHCPVWLNAIKPAMCLWDTSKDNQQASPKRKKNGPTKHSFYRVVWKLWSLLFKEY